MNKLIPLKEFKYEIESFSLMVEHVISSDMKNMVSFYLGGKNIWSNSYSSYVKAEEKFLVIKNIIKKIKIKFADLKSEDVNPEKIKEISKDFLVEFKKVK